MAQRVFTSGDQLDFAELSGDFNPLHLDPVLARRLVFGRRVVHGLHALLWSLDCNLKSCNSFLVLRTVKANFQAGIGVNQTVRCRISRQNQYCIAIRLEADSTPAAWFEISWHPERNRRSVALAKMASKPLIGRKKKFEEVAAASGSVDLYLDDDLAVRLFPNLKRVLPPVQLGVLLATTRLVGMECPGTHSIFSSLDLSFYAGGDEVRHMIYHVTDCNKGLALVSMDVEAPGMAGQIKAFLRPLPQKQAAFSVIRRQVDSDEFSAQQALIVGGSRGLGEVAAKLLAAGGAEVNLTYYRGEQEARSIVAEIVAQGAHADCFPLNVLEPLQGLMGRLVNYAKPLYLYYFATPYIFGAARGKFSPRRFAHFSEYYVTGFFKTVRAVADRPTGLQKAFYPSSAAIDELPLDMGEYAAAKMAGEVICDFLQKAHPPLVIYKPRLPRVATDQTVSLLPVVNQDPVPVLLDLLRNLGNL